jgi:hypothetical protein
VYCPTIYLGGTEKTSINSVELAGVRVERPPSNANQVLNPLNAVLGPEIERNIEDAFKPMFTTSGV